MSQAREVPPGLSRGQLEGWVRLRTMYINRFHVSHWYPNVCLQARIDLGAADALRKRLRAEEPHPSRRVTFNHMITKAAANALRNHILFNGKYTRRDSALIYERIHAANVVDTGGMASRVVIRDADRLGLVELAEETHRLVSARRLTLGEKLGRFAELQARTRLLETLFWVWPYVSRVSRELSHERAVDYLADNPSTVVITNPGTLGVKDCKAMLFFGELLTCLRVMAIEEEAVLEDGRVRFRKVLPVGMDYDQRLCDAGPAARLLGEIRRNLEQPEPYLMGPAVESPDAPMAWPRARAGQRAGAGEED